MGSYSVLSSSLPPYISSDGDEAVTSTGLILYFPEFIQMLRYTQIKSVLQPRSQQGRPGVFPHGCWDLC